MNSAIQTRSSSEFYWPLAGSFCIHILLLAVVINERIHYPLTGKDLMPPGIVWIYAHMLPSPADLSPDAGEKAPAAEMRGLPAGATTLPQPAADEEGEAAVKPAAAIGSITT